MQNGINLNQSIIMKTVSDKDLIENPTPMQVLIMKEHEFLVGKTGKYLFHMNGSTIYVECSDGWVAIEPKIFKNMN
jgi:hypothetical protein